MIPLAAHENDVVTKFPNAERGNAATIRSLVRPDVAWRWLVSARFVALRTVRGGASPAAERAPSQVRLRAAPRSSRVHRGTRREHAFDARVAAAHLFAQARYQPAVVAAMSRPVLAPPKWYEYAPQFLDPGAHRCGTRFLARERRDTGARAKRIRRARRSHRRDHRRRDLLRSQYRPVIASSTR